MDAFEKGGQNESPALLSKSETQWLLGKICPSITFQYKMLSNIRKKIRAFADVDFPLLRKYNMVSFELGRDLEPTIAPSGLIKATKDLVRQRSRLS